MMEREGVKGLNIGLFSEKGAKKKWEWKDGTELDYENWNEVLNPKNKKKRNCVSMLSTDNLEDNEEWAGKW